MKFEKIEDELDYLRGLAEGERVVEVGNSGTTGWQGVTVKGSRGLCVKWDNLIEGGQLTTAVTHGTRRLRDVDCPFVQGITAWGANLVLTDGLTPKSDAEKVCMEIERETIKQLVSKLRIAKATFSTQPNGATNANS